MKLEGTSDNLNNVGETFSPTTMMPPKDKVRKWSKRKGSNINVSQAVSDLNGEDKDGWI